MVKSMARARSPRVPQITSTVERVTPAIAEDWLGKNAHNRDLRNRDVARYADAMRRGEWVLNGDPIRFDEDGNLLDGQHRLWAVVESDVVIDAVVLRGLPSSAQETMDLGARRSLKDTLKLRGESDPSTLAATLNYHWKWTEGNVRVASSKPSIQQALAHLAKHPGLREARSATDRLRRRIRLSQAMISSTWYELRAIDADSADVFFEKLTTGTGLQKNDPILVLRGWLERQSISAVGTRTSTLVTHAMILKAWNFWRDGQQINGLNWKTTGTQAETFPIPR